LKARARKTKLDASKPVVTAAAKSESKMDAFAKEKCIETKVLQKRTRLLDVAEMKRITDGMDAEAKNFEGLKGAKNKLFQR
jgi:hypothetical protein